MTSHAPDGLQLARIEAGGDSRISSCMALYRKIFSDPKIQKIVEGAPAAIHQEVSKRPKPPRKAPAVITEKTVAEMKRLYYGEKLTLGEIGERLGVSRSRTWVCLKNSRTNTNK